MLVVAARKVGLSVTGAALLRAAPGPLGPVYDGCGGAGGALPLVGVVMVARRCGRWWWQRVWLDIGRSAPGTAFLCATPGPLGLVDGGSGGCWRCPPIAVAVARHRGRWRVVAHERWEWSDRRRALARNAWAFRPGGQRRGMGATGGP